MGVMMPPSLADLAALPDDILQSGDAPRVLTALVGVGYFLV